MAKFKLAFAVIGCQKSGTTWLHNSLATSSEVCLPAYTKELNFFNFNYQKGQNWYAGHFDQHERICGEASPEYILSLDALRRIRHDYPEVKIIVLLRRPVERSIAHFKHLVRTRGFSGSFSEAVAKYPQIVTWSKYEAQLANVFEIFPASNVCLVIFEDMIRNQNEVLQDIGKFIGVPDYSKLLPVQEKYEFYIPKYPRLYSWFRQLSNLIRSLGFERFTIGLKETVVQLLGRSGTNAPALTEAEIANLREELGTDERYIRKILRAKRDYWQDL